MFRRLMQAYLVEQRAAHRLVDEVELDRKSRDRAHFAMSLLTEAVAPTNNLLTNPNAVAKAVQTRGQSLVAGARHLAHDVRHNGGMPSQVDTRPFQVGRNLAVTPGQVVHRTEMFELIQYAPSTTQVHARPLVVVPPQINKYYITDLAPGRSLVEATVAAGIPYFTLSWRNPTPEQRDWNLDTYAAACREAIEVACDITGSDDANVAGMCAGGITLAALLGHLAATGESSLVHSATFCVAGLDSTTESTVSSLMSRRAIEAARARSRRAGILSGDDMAKVFAWLRPNDLVWNYWVNNYLMGENPPAFDILYWNNDTTRLPAGLHSDFLDLSLTNGLVEGTLDVLGTTVDLGNVTCDTFVVAGHTDHQGGDHPVGRRLPDDPGDGRRQHLRAQQRWPHPGHPQPARQPEGGVPRLRDAAAHRGGVARARHPGRGILVDGLARVARRSLGREGPRSQAPGQRRAPAAGRCPRPVRPPVMTDQRTFVRVDGHLLRVSVRGEGTPILLIMGLGGNIEMWAPLERELNAHGYQTIAYDASGTGNSPARLVPLRPSGLARQAAHLLDALGLPTVDVLGVSFGGGVAQELTLRNPHRVRRLVLASTMCGLGGVPGTPLALAVLATPLRYYSPRFMRATARWVYGPVHDSDGTLMRHQIVARRSRPPTLWGYLSQLYAVTGWTSLPWLHRITAPTLVLSGANDPVVPPVNARILAARIPNATVHVEPDTGHLLLMERAPQCAALIAEFLRP